MLRRLTLGVLASSLLTLASVAVAGAQAMPSPPAPAADGQEGAAAGAVVVMPSRTNHPGDQVFGAPCADCRVIVDPCEFMAVCVQVPGGLPFPPALHWTTLRPTVVLFFPEGPYVCAPPVGRNRPMCVDAMTAGLMPPGGQFTLPGGQTPGARPGQPATPTAPGTGGQQSQTPSTPQSPPAPAEGGQPTSPSR